MEDDSCEPVQIEAVQEVRIYAQKMFSVSTVSSLLL